MSLISANMEQGHLRKSLKFRMRGEINFRQFALAFGIPGTQLPLSCILSDETTQTQSQGVSVLLVLLGESSLQPVSILFVPFFDYGENHFSNPCISGMMELSLIFISFVARGTLLRAGGTVEGGELVLSVRIVLEFLAAGLGGTWVVRVVVVPYGGPSRGVVLRRAPSSKRVSLATERTDKAFSKIIISKGVHKWIHHAICIGENSEHLEHVYFPSRESNLVLYNQMHLESPVGQPTDDVHADNQSN